EEGSLPRHTFDVLRGLLAAGSGEDAECVAAVWNGWGHLHGGATMFAWLADGGPAPEPPKPPPTPYPAEVLDGPVLELPAREYFTFTCTLATAHEPSVYDQWAA